MEWIHVRNLAWIRPWWRVHNSSLHLEGMDTLSDLPELPKDAVVTMNNGETAYLSATQCGQCNEVVFITWPRIPNFCAGCGCAYKLGVDQLVIILSGLVVHSRATATTPGLPVNTVLSLCLIEESAKQALARLNQSLRQTTKQTT